MPAKTDRDVGSHASEVVFFVTIRQAIDVDCGATEADEVDGARHAASGPGQAGGSVELGGRFRDGLGFAPRNPARTLAARTVVLVGCAVHKRRSHDRSEPLVIERRDRGRDPDCHARSSVG
jgi:hypothetical protein